MWSLMRCKTSAVAATFFWVALPPVVALSLLRGQTNDQAAEGVGTRSRQAVGGVVAGQHHQRSKFVWTYWDDPEPPEFIALCLQTLRSRAGDTRDLHVVTSASVQKYVASKDLPPAFHSLQASFKSDAVRLALLRRHGGVWIDATAIAAKNLSTWVDPEFDKGKHFIGFYIDHFTRPLGGLPLVASWAIAVPTAEDRVLVAWHEAYLKLWQTRTVAESITADAFFSNVDLCCVPPWKQDYLHIELILLALLQKDSSLMEHFSETSTVFRAEDTAYAVQESVGLPWMQTNRCLPVTMPLTSFPVKLQKDLRMTPLLKLRHEDREWLMRMPQSLLVGHPNSLIGSLLATPNAAPSVTQTILQYNNDLCNSA